MTVISRPTDTLAQPACGHVRLKGRRSTGLLIGCALLGVAALFPAVSAQQSPPTHPLTGRQIASVYTDTRWLDRAQREEEEQPDRALELVGITPGMIVADVGAGSGYMTVRLARRVGPSGKIYANDLQASMLTLLQDKVRSETLTNVVFVQGTETETRLPASAIDLAILVDVYHEFWNPQQMLRSIRQSLKPNGQLVLLEYRKEDPRLPIMADHKMSVAEVRTEIEPEGFVFDRLIPDLPRQHIIVFRRPTR
jgi:ubiquinone/menaquinone biosynthesis C-methylase UbiE